MPEQQDGPLSPTVGVIDIGVGRSHVRHEPDTRGDLFRPGIRVRSRAYTGAVDFQGLEDSGEDPGPLRVGVEGEVSASPDRR